MPELPPEDLDAIVSRTSGWDELRGGRLLITGGTGFFGHWLLESVCLAIDRLGLDTEVVVLSRKPEHFREKSPHVAAHPAVRLHEGDVRTFDFPPGQFSHVIHAATEASARLNEEQPWHMIDTIVGGTRRTLEFAGGCGARKLLFTSSGAVYGPQPPDISHVAEDYPGGPNPLDPQAAYAEGKRLAETLCAAFAREHGLEVKIARCFAFVGPHLPLDAHYAIGNFILDAVRGQVIQVRGDGTPVRSYLYAADLTAWLWRILFHGRCCRPYNVGSEAAVSIVQVAEAVAGRMHPPGDVRVHGRPDPTRPPQRYVPSTQRVRTELGVGETVDLSDAIARTLAWLGRGAELESCPPCEPREPQDSERPEAVQRN